MSHLFTTQKVLYGFLALLLLIVGVQSLTKPRIEKLPLPKPEVTCKGTPIVVNYTFPHPDDPAFTNTWECQVQCDGEKQRYILYTNGTATQCEEPPNCLDWGEDNLVTCIIHSLSVIEETE